MASDENRFEIVYTQKKGAASMRQLEILRDKETGVLYLQSWYGYAGGITPLLEGPLPSSVR